MSRRRIENLTIQEVNDAILSNQTALAEAIREGRNGAQIQTNLNKLRERQTFLTTKPSPTTTAAPAPGAAGRPAPRPVAVVGVKTQQEIEQMKTIAEVSARLEQSDIEDKLADQRMNQLAIDMGNFSKVPNTSNKQKYTKASEERFALSAERKALAIEQRLLINQAEQIRRKAAAAATPTAPAAPNTSSGVGAAIGSVATGAVNVIGGAAMGVGSAIGGAAGALGKSTLKTINPFGKTAVEARKNNRLYNAQMNALQSQIDNLKAKMKATAEGPEKEAAKDKLKWAEKFQRNIVDLKSREGHYFSSKLLGASTTLTVPDLTEGLSLAASALAQDQAGTPMSEESIRKFTEYAEKMPPHANFSKNLFRLKMAILVGGLTAACILCPPLGAAVVGVIMAIKVFVLTHLAITAYVIPAFKVGILSVPAIEVTGKLIAGIVLAVLALSATQTGRQILMSPVTLLQNLGSAIAHLITTPLLQESREATMENISNVISAPGKAASAVISAPGKAVSAVLSAPSKVGASISSAYKSALDALPGNKAEEPKHEIPESLKPTKGPS